jgi:aspartyl-tRNA(Asn)/glutamyl-tRNA(Gln) amidotransferase subunit A
MLRLRERRAALIHDVRERLDGFDAFICPTVPIVAPTIESLADDDAYTRTNLLLLRNPTVVNMLDGCAVSIPLGDAEAPPTELMIAGLAHSDLHTLQTAKWMEERL